MGTKELLEAKEVSIDFYLTAYQNKPIKHNAKKAGHSGEVC